MTCRCVGSSCAAAWGAYTCQAAQIGHLSLFATSFPKLQLFKADRAIRCPSRSAPQGYAWFFLGYEATVNHFLQNAGPGVHTKADLNYLQVMAAGVVAGFGLWGSMFPIDTIKSKMQVRAYILCRENGRSRMGSERAGQTRQHSAQLTGPYPAPASR